MRTVWQTVRRITNEILGVKRVKQVKPKEKEKRNLLNEKK